MRDRLICADRPAELLAFLCMSNRHLQRVLRDARELCSKQHLGGIASPCEVAAQRLSGYPWQPMQLTCDVKRIQRLQMRRNVVDDYHVLRSREHEQRGT